MGGDGGLNSVKVSREQTHTGTGVLLAPAVQDTSCPRDTREANQRKEKSDLTKWAGNDSSVHNKII